MADALDRVLTQGQPDALDRMLSSPLKAGRGRTGARLKGEPEGLPDTFMGTIAKDFAAIPEAVLRIAPATIAGMRHPISTVKDAAKAVGQIPASIAQDIKDRKYGKLSARALELILPGLGSEKAAELAGAAASATGRATVDAASAAGRGISSAASATGRVAKAVAPELPGAGIVSRVRARLNPAAATTAAKSLSIAEMKAAVKRGAMSMEDYSKSLVGQGYSESHAATMADNLKAEIGSASAKATPKTEAKAPKPEKAPYSKLSDAPRVASKPISIDELKSAVKRKAMSIEQYEQELIKQGYPSGEAKVMAENLQHGVSMRTPAGASGPSPARPATAATPETPGKTSFIQHLKDRGPMRPAEHAEQLAKWLKSRGISPSDLAHDGDWKIAAAAAGLPEPTPEIIEAARGQLAWRRAPSLSQIRQQGRH